MRGGFANRQAVIIMIQVAPPQRPECYRTQKQWIDWLIAAHRSNLKVTRKLDTGKTQGNRQTSLRLLPTSQIAYCTGCTRGYQREMEERGMCHPSAATHIEEEEAALA